MARRFSLPLLTKELYEQSARWQTYAYRVAYALLLFTAALWFFRDILERQAASPLDVLGQGRDMFLLIVRLQLIGVYLFMPALTCNAITLEKERNTLGTLLLTKLGATTIIFEKLLSRMIPMLGFQLLSLPLLAYTYALGGLTMSELIAHIWILFLATVQVGAFAMCCSVFSSTTVGSFVMTYALGAVMLVGFPFVCCTAPVLYSGNLSSHGWELAVAYTLPALFTTTVCLMLASNFLVTKAFSEPRNYLLEVFRHLDGVFHDLNQTFTGGILLVDDSVSLPMTQPVSWRETKKKSLGTVRYLFRILSCIEVPLLFVLTWFSEMQQYRYQTATAMLGIVWALSLVLLSVLTTSLIAGERSRQTLDVLLTVPLSGADLLRQKLHGVWRMVGVLTVPMLTIAGYEWWWEGQAWTWSQNRALPGWAYLLFSVLAPLIYLPCFALVGMVMGFVFRSQARAMLVTLVVLVGWNALPLWTGTTVFAAVIPSALIWQVEEKQLPMWQGFLNLGLYAGLFVGLTWILRKHADSLLGRAEPRAEVEPEAIAGTAVAPA